MKQNTLIIIAALIAGVAGIAAQRFNSTPSPVTATTTSLLTTQLPDLAGKSHPLSEWRGKILIINFWATWCPPCLTEIPEFMALQKQYTEQNVQFIGIAIEEKPAVANYNATAKINYPLLIAGDAGINLSKTWGNNMESVPFTVVLNQQGQIIYRQLGEINRKQLLAVIQPLMKNSTQP